MQRAYLGMGVVAISLAAIGACVADEPATTGSTTDSDASSGSSDGASGGDGQATGNDGSTASDSGVDAGVRCGYARGAGSMTGSSSTDLWLSASDDRPFHFDGGTSFRFPPQQARAVWGHSQTDVWGGDTAFQHFDGASWSSPFALTYADGGAPGTVYAMSGSATDNVWAVGGTDTTAFASRWDGTQWNTAPIPGAALPQVVWAPAKDQVFVVDKTSTLFAWNGTAWSTVTIVNPPSASMSWAAISGSALPRP